MAGGGGGQEELNLVPYLDIMVNLIMFMLLATAYIVELKESPVLPPAYGGGAGSGSEQKPYLTIAMADAGYAILGGASAEGNVPIGKRGDQYDTKALTAKLKELKATVPNLSESVVITAGTGQTYKDVMATMDAARFDGDPKRPLFTGVTLAQVVTQ
jgi:biopolymer transport protein ExbD